MIHIKLANKKNVSIMLTSLAVSACMMISSFACGNVAYGAEAPAGDENFNYNGYSATQLKKISECISGVVPESECPAYEASSKDYYTETGGAVNHANMPAGVISTKAGWLQWADAAMKANSYDGVYGTLRIAPGGATGESGSASASNEVINVRFRLVGINQDNRADGTGKAGLTFQAIGNYNILSAMNTVSSNSSGGWRDSMLRKNLNDESTGTIWNAIQSTDFKNNITPVLKANNNNANSDIYNTSKASSITADKLYILSPSEMGMPIIKNYNVIYGYYSYYDNQLNANVHYYNSDSYKNTIKLLGNYDSSTLKWYTLYNYLYDGNTYQWWMLPSEISSDSREYHNINSYCRLYSIHTGSNYCYDWLRSNYSNSFGYYTRNYQGWQLIAADSSGKHGVVVSFSL